MQKLILTRGIPGSGKSTWAKQYIEGHTNCVRVNRDSLRWMVYNAPYTADKRLEKLVRHMEQKAVSEALQAGYDVVLDNTHCALSAITKIIYDIENQFDGDVQIIVVDFPISTTEAIRRDRLRDYPVGNGVIESMHKLLADQKSSPDYLTVQKLVVESRELSK